MINKIVLILFVVSLSIYNYTLNWNGDPNLVSWPD